jgi:hypothetical protein
MQNDAMQKMLLNQFKGVVRPISRRRAQVPAYDDKLICGKRGNYYSVIRFWIYPPTEQYPYVGIHFSLSNGSGSSFTQVTPTDIDNLIHELEKWRDESKPIIDKLQLQADEFEKTAQSARDMNEVIELLRSMGNQDYSEEETSEDDFEDQPTQTDFGNLPPVDIDKTYKKPNGKNRTRK